MTTSTHSRKSRTKRLRWFALSANDIPTHYILRSSQEDAYYAASNHMGIYLRDYQVKEVRRPPLSWIRARITRLNRLAKEGLKDLAPQRRKEVKMLKGLLP